MNHNEQADYDSLMADAKAIRSEIEQLTEEVSELEGREMHILRGAAAIRSDAEERERLEREAIEDGLSELCRVMP